MPVAPIPHGFHSATPYLVVSDAATAIAFYKQAFGATDLMPPLLDPESGKIAHAEIMIGNSPIMLCDEFPEWGNRSPQSLGGTTVLVHLYVDDVDAVAARALAAGAETLIPVADQFYGDRAGRMADPFGHVWILATHKEDVAPDEMQRRMEAFLRPEP